MMTTLLDDTVGSWTVSRFGEEGSLMTTFLVDTLGCVEEADVGSLVESCSQSGSCSKAGARGVDMGGLVTHNFKLN